MVQRKTKKAQSRSFQDLKTVVQKTADMLENHPKFKEGIVKQIRKDKEFREFVVLLTARKLFKK